MLGEGRPPLKWMVQTGTGRDEEKREQQGARGVERARAQGSGAPDLLTPTSLNRANLGDVDVVRALEVISHFWPYPAA